MVIRDMYFKRQRRLRNEDTDVYQYENLPNELLVQVVHIWQEVLGNDYSPSPDVKSAYTYMVEALRKELGVFRLPSSERYDSIFEEWYKEFLNQEDIEIQLSMIELANEIMLGYAARYEYRRLTNAEESAAAGLAEINARFREHGVGYSFTASEILRVDSQFLHSEVVIPALTLLHSAGFEGTQAEFLKAHEEYRHGDTKGALTESLKAFESVMKVICKKRGWTYDSNATSKHLLNILFEKKLIPEYWQSHFAGLRTTLESGVPTARNKDGGHGQGEAVKVVPMHLAGYVLHQTAAAIVFLVEAERALS